MDVATKLKCYRLMLGLSQDDVARAIGVERTTYACYELKLSRPSPEIIRTLAALYSIMPERLMDPPEAQSVTPSIVFHEQDMVLADIALEPQSGRVSSDKEPMYFGALSPDEKELVIQYRIKKAIERRAMEQAFQMNDQWGDSDENNR